jgi:lysophospholipase L1-like esterase
MIGDSITQGSRQALEFAMAAGGYPAPVIDADDGRRIATGDDPLRGTQVLSNLMAMDIRPTVWVIALGTNDAGSYQDRAAYAALVDEMLILLPPASPVVWIDVYRPDVGEHVTMFNDALAERVGARPASAIGSWFAIASAKEQQVLRGDRVHPNVDGQRAFAELVMSTVSRL